MWFASQSKVVTKRNNRPPQARCERTCAQQARLKSPRDKAGRSATLTRLCIVLPESCQDAAASVANSTLSSPHPQRAKLRCQAIGSQSYDSVRSMPNAAHGRDCSSDLCLRPTPRRYTCTRLLKGGAKTTSVPQATRNSHKTLRAQRNNTAQGHAHLSGANWRTAILADCPARCVARVHACLRACLRAHARTWLKPQAWLLLACARFSQPQCRRPTSKGVKRV